MDPRPSLRGRGDRGLLLLPHVRMRQCIERVEC